jgi:predicted HicB family RNase H-like nuclease
MHPVVATPDVRHYSYALAWSSDDHEYVATVAEFPSLSWLDADQDAALGGIRRLVGEVVDDLVESGEPVPVSFGERRFSGEFRLRTTPDMHRRLTIGAAQQGVSLNRYVNSLLSR